MFAKSNISFAIDRSFEKTAAYKFVSDIRSYDHLNGLALLNQKQFPLKKIKKQVDWTLRNIKNEDQFDISVPNLQFKKIDYENNYHVELAASVVGNSSSLAAGGSQMLKLLGGLALGGAGAAMGGGGGGSSSGLSETNPPDTSVGGGDGVRYSISPVVFYSQQEVDSASAAIKDLLLAYEPNRQGVKWGNALHSGGVLTYGFSDAGASQYSGSYIQSGSKANGYATGVTTFTDAQKALALEAMQSYASVSGIVFRSYKNQATNALDAVEVAGAAGDIRWSNTSHMPNAAGIAYYPDSIEGSKNLGIGGDIWITAEYLYIQNPSWDWAKGYVRYLFIHELGHALGLTHPHETPMELTQQDTIKYTVMSYKDFLGDTNLTLQSDYFPTTMMLNDIAAIQYLYGANTNIHAENTVYQWSAQSKIFETIYDAGGIDTIDASNQLEAVRINLNPGTFSNIGVGFSDGRDYVRDCLAMSYTVTIGGKVINLIENATGSEYADILIGNDANNVLVGNAGDDFLNGGLGDDTLRGGLGLDTLNGGTGGDNFVFDQALADFDYIQDFSLSQNDVLTLSHTIFTALTEIGQLLNRHFVAGADLTSGQNADQYIIYNTNDGHLYYDSDGNGTSDSVCFAILDNLVQLNANSFNII